MFKCKEPKSMNDLLEQFTASAQAILETQNDAIRQEEILIQAAKDRKERATAEANLANKFIKNVAKNLFGSDENETN